MLRFVVWILLLAAVVYAVFWLLDRRAGSGPRRGPGGNSRPVRPSGPKGPDDDEDFLRDLDFERRRQARRSGPRPGDNPGQSGESRRPGQSGTDDGVEPPHA